MNGEETGGVAGLRAWAADAAERAKRLLLPAVRGGAVPSGAYDASVAELEQLAPLLDHDPGLRSTVRVWLGGALAARSLAGRGGPGGPGACRGAAAGRTGPRYGAGRGGRRGGPPLGGVLPAAARVAAADAAGRLGRRARPLRLRRVGGPGPAPPEWRGPRRSSRR
ncbi:hypothetical protein IHE61_28045 [Streptomyces sp. GKU 257-1]|nr:hypothetical protein [Streptomyces sp. GKU 257-1]